MADEDQIDGAEVEVAKKEAGSTGKNPLVTILLLLNMVAMSVVAYFQFQFLQMEAKRPDLTALLKESNKEFDPEAEGEQKPVDEIKKESLFELETFTVNLAQGDGPRRYVRLNAVLKLSENSEFSEVEARKPQIRDTIINILNSKRPEDLLKREGKYNLKQEIKSAINSFLIDGDVVDIFYVGFQIN